MHLRRKNTLLDQTSDYVESAGDQIEETIDRVKEAVEEFIESTAKPALADARDHAVPLIDDAKAKAIPAVAAGAALAADKAERAKEYAETKAAEHQTQPEPGTSWWKRLALVGVLAGIAGYIAKQAAARQQPRHGSPDVPAPRPIDTETGVVPPQDRPTP